MDARLKQSYWKLVIRCMTELFGAPADDAKQQVYRLRDVLEDAPAHVNPDFIYHDEPLNVAIRLTYGSDLSAREFKQLQEQHAEGYHRLQAALIPTK